MHTWSRSLLKMAMLGQFMHVRRNFERFHMLGPGRWNWGNHTTAWNLVAWCSLPWSGSLYEMATCSHFLITAGRGCCRSLNVLSNYVNMNILHAYIIILNVCMIILHAYLACIHNRPVSQMRAPLVACHELALDYNTLPKLLYIFEHKTYYVLIHALYTRIVAFWHISNIPPMIS